MAVERSALAKRIRVQSIRLRQPECPQANPGCRRNRSSSIYCSRVRRQPARELVSCHNADSAIHQRDCERHSRIHSHLPGSISWNEHGDRRSNRSSANDRTSKLDTVLAPDSQSLERRLALFDRDNSAHQDRVPGLASDVLPSRRPVRGEIPLATRRSQRPSDPGRRTGRRRFHD